MLLQKMNHILKPSFMENFVKGFYSQIQLSCFFSIMIFPWFIANHFLILSVETLLIFAVCSIGIWPNIYTLFHVFSLKNDQISFHIYRKLYIGFVKRRKKEISVISIITTILFFELLIILSNSSLIIYFPIYFSVLVFTSVSFLHYIFMTQSEVRDLKAVKQSLMIGWGKVITSIICSLLIALWVSVSYYISFINIVFGNVLFFRAIYVLVERKHKKD